MPNLRYLAVLSDDELCAELRDAAARDMPPLLVPAVELAQTVDPSRCWPDVWGHEIPAARRRHLTLARLHAGQRLAPMRVAYRRRRRNRR